MWFGRSFLEIADVSLEQIQALYSLAEKIENSIKNNRYPTRSELGAKQIGLVFLEPSTRTKLSFTSAANHLRYSILNLEVQSSSLQKGESVIDTLLNTQALGVSLFVVRCKEEGLLQEATQYLKVPIINAGEGISGHPTQALLDVYSMKQILGSVKNKNILIVGDVKHSRVARSNRDLLTKLGANVAVCCPEDYAPSDFHKVFNDIDEALQWADVAMALRIQWERHAFAPREKKHLDYVQSFSISKARLEKAKNVKALLHPGPVNWGVELQMDVVQDPRCKILQQVENGVYVRAALLASILGSEVL